jgi:hypothetical protein
LPISRVSSRESASLLSSTSRPIRPIVLPRTGAGVAAQARCASRAVRQASTNPSASVSHASQTSSSRLAGLRDSTCVPPSRVCPPMIEATVLVCVTLMRLA